MNPEITKIIEQYLNNELSESDKAAFEQRLNENSSLRAEVDLQKSIHEGAKRAARRTVIKQTGKSYHLKKNLVTTSVIVVVAAAIAVGTYVAVKQSEKKKEGIPTEAYNALVSKLETEAPMEDIPAEYFELSKADTVVLSQNGVLLSVPEGAFLLDGKSYSGTKVVQWQEAMDAATIVKGGLSTMSGSNLLETQGMFGIQAFTPDGRKLKVNPKVGVYVQVPVDELKEGMQLFEGKPKANGVIDWQNPKPLEKKPVMANMKDLDFYPPGYEAELNKQKWKTGKKSRDSLYLSLDELDFSGSQKAVGVAPPAISKSLNTPMREGTPAPRNMQTTGWNDKIKWDVKAIMTDEKNGYIEARAKLIPGWYTFSMRHNPEKNDMIGIPTGFTSLLSTTHRFTSEFVEVTKPLPFGEVGGALIFENEAVFRQKFVTQTNRSFVIPVYIDFQICNEDGCIYPPSQRFSVTINGTGVSDSVSGGDHILPASVLGFWNPKFNKTLLSTRDFEKRMIAVHKTCNEEVLKQYTGNLGKPMYEIDERVAAMGYPEFGKFAAERVGAVKMDDPHITNLQAFYERSIALLKEKAKSDKDFVRKLEAEYDSKIYQSRASENSRKVVRNSQNYSEEFELNYSDCLHQLGKTRKPVVGFIITGGAPVYNLDRFVAEMTMNRTSGSFYDSETGKTAKIQYNAFSVSVDKHEQYDKLFLYLFPHEMNSFQRIDPKKTGLFDYPLNNIIQYDLAVIGINENSYHIYTQKGLNKGALGLVKLEKVSEKEFNKQIERLNSGRNSSPIKISEELKWLSEEKKDYKVQRLRKEMRVFRSTMKGIVFPCLITGGEYAPAEDVTEEIEY